MSCLLDVCQRCCVQPAWVRVCYRLIPGSKTTSRVFLLNEQTEGFLRVSAGRASLPARPQHFFNSTSAPLVRFHMPFSETQSSTAHSCSTSCRTAPNPVSNNQQCQSSLEGSLSSTTWVNTKCGSAIRDSQLTQRHWDVLTPYASANGCWRNSKKTKVVEDSDLTTLVRQC